MKTKLLLLHGALGSSKQFEALRQLLTEHFDVYVLDFEGHGGRMSENHFAIDLFAENVIQFLDEDSIDQIDIFGYSMGGYVALKTALNQPDRIGKIITLGTKFNWDKASTEKEVAMLNPVAIEEKVPQFAAKLKAEHAPADWKILLEKTAAMMTDLSLGKALSDRDLEKIAHKVTIALGSEDRMVSAEESEHAAALLSGGKFVKLQGIPHPIDKVDAMQLSDFITRELSQQR